MGIQLFSWEYKTYKQGKAVESAIFSTEINFKDTLQVKKANKFQILAFKLFFLV